VSFQPFFEKNQTLRGLPDEELALDEVSLSLAAEA